LTIQGIFKIRLALAAAALLVLAVPAQAGAAPTLAGAPSVAIGGAAIGTSGGQTSLLVPVRYPIELAGRVVKTRVALLDSSRRTVRSWTLRRRLGSGSARLPERRRSFTFVHQIQLGQKLVRAHRGRWLLRVTARGVLDIEGDGRAELRSGDRGVLTATTGPRRQLLCGSLPHLRVDPGKRVVLPLPACDHAIEWAVRGKSTRGGARIRDGRLIYRAPKRFRGSDTIHLVAKEGGASAHASRVTGSASADAEVTVGASNAVVRAFGDSVTAGFGFLWSGEEMDGFPIGLYECRPAAKEMNDACSSNSYNEKSGEGPPNFTLDYGLSKKVSWAAQWARQYGITNYKNYAISGSEPKNWAPGGEFHKYLEELEKEDPDYVLFTIGANPLLSRALIELKEFECEGTKTFRECVEKEFREVELRRYLQEIYAELVKQTTATIFVMQYHLAIPWGAVFYSNEQVAELELLFNLEIASVAAGFSPARLQLVAPPHFSVGISPFPFFQPTGTCSDGGVPVDGLSAQSKGTQLDFKADYEFGRVKEYCPGRPWVINTDTGIHPNTYGYAQMASRVPVPK
jgi:GDSL-like lipase/acylhydrolase family protein